MRKFNTEEFTKNARNIHGERYNYDKVNYVNNRTKVSIICPIHGEFFQTPYKHLIGHGCSDCGGRKKWNIDTFIKKSIEVHGSKYCYNDSYYINGVTPLKIICYDHGEFFQTPGNHLSGEGCGKCAKNVRLNTNEFIIKANKIHKNKYNYSKTVYGKNNIEKVVIICPIHGEFIQEPSHHLSGQGCSKCTSNVSNKEREFLGFIRIPDTKENRQKRMFQFKVDGFDQNTNTVYEFLGDYFHGNPKKFESDDYNKTCHKTFGELYQNTFNKFKRLKSLGYNVKYIWESHWDDWKENIKKNIFIEEYN